MGEAIVAGLIAARVAQTSDISVADPDEARRAHLSASYGVEAVPDGSKIVGSAGVIILAVKPQSIDPIVASWSSSLTDPMPVVVSIAAGVPCGRLEALLPPGTPVVRVMPNTPATIGEGVSAVSAGAHARDDHVAVAVELFSALGKVFVVEEGLQDAVTAVSGSGPAYVAIFIEALARAGERHGLGADAAYVIALQTVRGTVDLLLCTGQGPRELIDAVSSPGGTTIAARTVLEAGRFADIVAEAVDAAVARSKELGVG